MSTRDSRVLIWIRFSLLWIIISPSKESLSSQKDAVLRVRKRSWDRLESVKQWLCLDNQFIISPAVGCRSPSSFINTSCQCFLFMLVSQKLSWIPWIPLTFRSWNKSRQSKTSSHFHLVLYRVVLVWVRSALPCRIIDPFLTSWHSLFLSNCQWAIWPGM